MFERLKQRFRKQPPKPKLTTDAGLTKGLSRSASRFKSELKSLLGRGQLNSAALSED